jgi:DNA-binding MarR family transcriptional regulator
MATSAAIRMKRANGISPMLVDVETRVTEADHQALRLWLRLLSCHLRIENQIRARLRNSFATTLARFDLMAQLERHADGLRMSDLSRSLMVTGGNVTGIADQLEREKLVLRVLDRADRRAIRVRLTAAGLARFREMAVQHEQWIVELFGGLSEQEKRTIYGLLHKLKLHLNGVAVMPSAAKTASRRGAK